MFPRPPPSPLFPYTTLFRSLDLHGREVGVEGLEPQPVVEDHGVAVDRERVGEGHDAAVRGGHGRLLRGDRKSTRLNSSHTVISYAVFCLKKKKIFNQVKYL